jgi:hypothetical protein
MDGLMELCTGLDGEEALPVDAWWVQAMSKEGVVEASASSWEVARRALKNRRHEETTCPLYFIYSHYDRIE